MEVEVKMEVAIMICDGFIYSFIFTIDDEEVVQGTEYRQLKGSEEF